MIMKYLKFENSRYELLRYNDKIIIKDKKTNKFFETIYTSQFNDVNWKVYTPRISKKVIITVFVFVIIGLATNCFAFFFLRVPYSISYISFLVLSTIYTIIHVVLHELAHIICLLTMGKKPNKIGIKMNYIFPSIYVRMNDIHILANQEKILVHVAGIFVNIILNGIVLLFAYLLEIGILFTISQFLC